MASEKEKPARRDMHEAQDQSIKARKTQLFDEVEPVDAGTIRPFAEYLKATPPAPLAQGVKITLWAVGGLVALILLAALSSGRHHRPGGPGRTGGSRQRAVLAGSVLSIDHRSSITDVKPLESPSITRRPPDIHPRSRGLSARLGRFHFRRVEWVRDSRSIPRRPLRM